MCVMCLSFFIRQMASITTSYDSPDGGSNADQSFTQASVSTLEWCVVDSLDGSIIPYYSYYLFIARNLRYREYYERVREREKFTSDLNFDRAVFVTIFSTRFLYQAMCTTYTWLG